MFFRLSSGLWRPISATGRNFFVSSSFWFANSPRCSSGSSPSASPRWSSIPSRSDTSWRLRTQQPKPNFSCRKWSGVEGSETVSTSRSPASLASSSWWPTSYLLFCWFYFLGNQTSTASSLLWSMSALISISYLSFTLSWLMMKLNDQFLAGTLIKL